MHGITQARELLERLTELILLGGEGARGGKIHPYLQNLMNYDGKIPSVDMLELTDGLAERDTGMFGCGGNATYSALRNIIKAAGLSPDKWGICQTCGGDGVIPAIREAYKAWKDYDPPEGDGFQLWETTSEGSPISPVFKTLDELCEWAEKNATTFGSFKATKEEWKKMLSDGLVYHEKDNLVFI